MTTRRTMAKLRCSFLKGQKIKRWLWLPIIVTNFTIYAIAVYFIIHFNDGRAVKRKDTTRVLTSFLVDSTGCRIPELDPWGPMVQKFLFQPDPINCVTNRQPPLVASNLTSLFVVEEAVPFYAENSSQIECCYQPFQRKRSDYEILTQKECRIFETATYVQDEFVRVLCSVGKKKIYEDYHAFVQRKPDVEKRCKNASFRSTSFGKSSPSVLVLGIDAVSRLNVHRQMPLTVELLKQMGAVEMLGYNKVGDNTFPNTVAILTGGTYRELRNICWPTSESHFDNCPFVWNDFRDAGFRTAYGEDGTDLGPFNYEKKGFINAPTDYYLHPFMKTIEEKIGHSRQGCTHLCVGSRSITQVLLQYVLNFARTFKEEPYYTHFWAGSLSHDFLNYPRLGDNMYVKLLLELRDSGALERTVMVMMSDHGLRQGAFRETYMGRLEERLPFLFLLFPDWFRKRFPTAVANVERNARRLTSHFDFFETLQDLIRTEERLSQEAVRGRSRVLAKATASPEGPPRGVSLFLPVPPDRTCDQAGIEPHWCTCLEKETVESSNEIVNRSATILVNHINQMIRSYRQCAHLVLAEIRNAQLQIPHRYYYEKRFDLAIRYYVIVVRTDPGGAIFEATVQHVEKTDQLIMAGFVSRLNLYGSQSACVSNYLLKLYCYCLT